MLRPRVTFSRNGMTSSMPSGPPNDRTRSASYVRAALSKGGAPDNWAPRVVIEVSTLTHVADGESGKLLIDRHHCAVVMVGFAGRRGCCEELADDRGHGNRSRALSGGGARYTKILPVQVDTESRFELMSHHRCTLQLEHPAGGQPSGEYLHDLVRIDAGLRAQHQRLADGCIVDGHDDLVAGLHDLTGTRRADMDDGLAHHLKERHRPLEVFSLPADHDAERTCDSALVAATYRSVERTRATLPHGGINLDRGRRRNRAHVNEQMPFIER